MSIRNEKWKKQLWVFHIYKIWQILKHFTGTFRWAQTLNLGGVLTMTYAVLRNLRFYTLFIILHFCITLSQNFSKWNWKNVIHEIFALHYFWGLWVPTYLVYLQFCILFIVTWGQRKISIVCMYLCSRYPKEIMKM